MSAEYTRGFKGAIQAVKNLDKAMESKDISMVCAILEKMVEIKVDTEKEEFQAHGQRAVARQEMAGSNTQAGNTLRCYGQDG